jgi:hypothetical protein
MTLITEAQRDNRLSKVRSGSHFVVRLGGRSMCREQVFKGWDEVAEFGSHC